MLARWVFHLLPFVFLCCISENRAPHGVLADLCSTKGFFPVFSRRGVWQCSGTPLLGLPEQR